MNPFAASPETTYRMILADREREFQQANLRRLAREARRDRTSTSSSTGMSGIFGAVGSRFHLFTRHPGSPEVAHAPCGEN